MLDSQIIYRLLTQIKMMAHYNRVITMRNIYFIIITLFVLNACSSKRTVSDAELEAQFEDHAADANGGSSGQLSDKELSEMYEAAGMRKPSKSRRPASADSSMGSSMDYSSYNPNMTPDETLVYASQHAVSRGPASQPKGKGAFWSLGSPCAVHAQPDAGSQVYSQLKDGRSLWVEPASDGWVMVQRQAGPGYMQSQCFQ